MVLTPPDRLTPAHLPFEGRQWRFAPGIFKEMRYLAIYILQIFPGWDTMKETKIGRFCA
jgi:hypothetical protein